MNYQARENDRSLPLPITQAANSIAWQFSQQQPTSQKAEQVRPLTPPTQRILLDFIGKVG